MNVIKVAVHAGDPLTRMVLASQVRSAPRFTLVPWQSAAQADAVVVVAETVDQGTARILNELGTAGSRSLLVVGRQPDADRSAIADSGVRAVLWRKDFTPTRFIHVLGLVGDGEWDPPPVVGRTRGEPRAQVGPVASEPDVSTRIELSSREIDILRLAAEGHEILEISQRVSYSERTIRNVFNDLMKQLNLRNRTHVVAYALRSGLI